jgi:hypothetical protein
VAGFALLFRHRRARTRRRTDDAAKRDPHLRRSRSASTTRRSLRDVRRTPPSTPQVGYASGDLGQGTVKTMPSQQYAQGNLGF